MKILKILFIIVLVIVVLFTIGTYLIIRNFDINQYKAQILNELSTSLGRKVHIDDIKLDISFGKGAALAITGLRIEDHPKYSQGNLLDVKSMRLDVDLDALFQEKKLIVTSIYIKSPSVTLIRSPYNEFNIQRIIKDKRIASSSKDKTSEGVQPEPKKNFPVRIKVEDNFSALLVESLWIEDAVLTFIDQETQPAKELKITQMDLQINDFSLDEPFKFFLKANLGAQRQDMHINGLARVDVHHQQARFDDVTVDIDLTDGLLQRIKPYLSPSPINELVTKMEAKMQATISQIVFGSEGVLVLTLSGDVNRGYVNLTKLASPIKDIKIAFNMTESELTFNSFSFQLGSGDVRGRGKVSEYLTDKELDFELDAKNISVEQVLSQSDQPVKVEGKVSGHLHVKGAGFDKENFVSSIEGEGHFNLLEGKLKDINVLKMILSKVSMLPQLVGTVEENLPDKYRDKLKSRDTDINKIAVQTKIHGGLIHFDKAEVDADSFTILGDGNIDFDQNIYLRAALYIPQDLTSAMVASVQELKFLLDEYGQIYIPLQPYRGKLSQIRMLPDMTYLGQKIILNVGSEQVEQLLDKALEKNDIPAEGSQVIKSILNKVLNQEEGKLNKPQDTGDTDTEAPEQPADPRPPEQMILENILNNVFE